MAVHHRKILHCSHVATGSLNEATNSAIKQTKQNITSTVFLDDFILCRSCGSDISSSNYLISRISPASHYTFNDTLFNREKVLIQVLSNDIFLEFPVITASHSNCVSVGEWEHHTSWFPGYRWKLCACPDCGDYIGWFFEPINPVELSEKPLFGLILTCLVGESCKYFFTFLGGWCVGFVPIVFVGNICRASWLLSALFPEYLCCVQLCYQCPSCL